jgi:hypothetical protein
MCNEVLLAHLKTQLSQNACGSIEKYTASEEAVIGTRFKANISSINVQVLHITKLHLARIGGEICTSSF